MTRTNTVRLWSPNPVGFIVDSESRETASYSITTAVP